MGNNVWTELLTTIASDFDEDEILATLVTAIGAIPGAKERRRKWCILGATPNAPDGLAKVSRSNQGNLILELAPSAPTIKELGLKIREALEDMPAWFTTVMKVDAADVRPYKASSIQFRSVEVTDRTHSSNQLTDVPFMTQTIPLLVDIEYRSCKDMAVNSKRLREASIAAQGIATLTCHPMPRRMFNSQSRSSFVLVWDQARENLESATFTPGFLHKQFPSGWCEAPPAVDLSDCQIVERSAFLSDLPTSQNFQVSTDAEALAITLRTMPAKRRRKFLRSLQWYVDAASAPHKQLVLLCAAFAVEALVIPDETDAKKCEGCHERLTVPSCEVCKLPKRQSTKAFNTFLRKYAGNVFRTRFLEQFYAARNHGAHGALHYSVDDSISNILPSTNDQDPTIALYAARAAICNWAVGQSSDDDVQASSSA